MPKKLSESASHCKNQRLFRGLSESAWHRRKQRPLRGLSLSAWQWKKFESKPKWLL